MFKRDLIIKFENICLYGFRPLHIAARHGLVSVVQLLLSKGADVLLADESGNLISCLSCDIIAVLAKEASLYSHSSLVFTKWKSQDRSKISLSK